MKIIFGQFPKTVASDEELANMSEGTDKEGLFTSGESKFERIIGTPYRKHTYTFSNGKVVEEGETYFFKVEPIVWDVMREYEDCYLLCTHDIIATGCFFQSFKDRELNGKTIYRNNWAGSDANRWLNETFYRKAFNKDERQFILDQKMNMQATCPYDNVFAQQDISRSNVILLTYADVTNPEFGFNPDPKSKDPLRQKSPTDYSRATGAFYFHSDGEDSGFGYWWLSNSAKTGANVLNVYKSGTIDMEGGLFNWSQYGYVPCILLFKYPQVRILKDEEFAATTSIDAKPFLVSDFADGVEEDATVDDQISDTPQQDIEVNEEDLELPPDIPEYPLEEDAQQNILLDDDNLEDLPTLDGDELELIEDDFELVADETDNSLSPPEVFFEDNDITGDNEEDFVLEEVAEENSDN